MVSFLIGAAVAEEATQKPNSLISLLSIIVPVGIFYYFLLMRPQQKKAKQHRELLASLKKGDNVVTVGGVVGTVSKVINDQEVIVDVSDGVSIKFLKGAISSVTSSSCMKNEKTVTQTRSRKSIDKRTNRADEHKIGKSSDNAILADGASSKKGSSGKNGK